VTSLAHNNKVWHGWTRWLIFSGIITRRIRTASIISKNLTLRTTIELISWNVNLACYILFCMLTVVILLVMSPFCPNASIRDKSFIRLSWVLRIIIQTTYRGTEGFVYRQLNYIRQSFARLSDTTLIHFWVLSQPQM